MLKKILDEINLTKELLSIKSYKPFPYYADRQQWADISEEIKSYYHNEAEKLNGQLWLNLPATYYLDYQRTGNRKEYENIYFKRREDVLTLMLAECLSGEKKYIDSIINGVWAICEESTWVVSAHNNQKHAGRTKEMPDIEEDVYIDLFSAETASLLSWVYYFLGDVIGDVSPIVKRRIEIEVERRILIPYLKFDDYGYMGLNHDKPVNNWNPWINSNVLTSYLIFSKDADMRLKGIEKTIISINRFIHFYNEDGGCDEGPGYFTAAAASLFDFLEELYEATKGKFQVYDNETIKNMARYISKVYIGYDHFVNFADAAPSISISEKLVERIGKVINDTSLIGFSQYLRKNEFADKSYLTHYGMIYRKLKNIMLKEEVTQYDLKLPKYNYFNGIQVLTARDNADTIDGLFVAAKAGNNAESHNHNDIGNFILYSDGNPVVIDAGVETYTKFTFSESRYNIWTMQSCYHNTPTINGFDQENGLLKCGTDVSFTHEDNISKLSLNLGSAYPNSNEIEYYNRSIEFRHGECLEITDNYSLLKCDKPLVINLMLFNEPKIQNGLIDIGENIAVSFDETMFSAEFEEIKLEDNKIRNDWKKDKIYRLVLIDKKARLHGTVKLKFYNYSKSN